MTKAAEVNTYESLFFFTTAAIKNIKLIANYGEQYILIIDISAY